MNVGQIIDELKKHPKEAKIYCCDNDDGRYYPIENFRKTYIRDNMFLCFLDDLPSRKEGDIIAIDCIFGDGLWVDFV